VVIIQVNSPNPNLKWQSDEHTILVWIFQYSITGFQEPWIILIKLLLIYYFRALPFRPAPPSSVVRWINLDGKIINKGFEVLLNAGIIRQQKIQLGSKR
jgi:iron complex outermembrane receptor protein